MAGKVKVVVGRRRVGQPPKKQRSGAQKYTARLKRMQWVQGQPTPGTEAYSWGHG